MFALDRNLEQIVRKSDFNLSIKFFILFSRFEYALKRSGYIKTREDKTAEADWDSFAEKHKEIIVESNYHEKLNEAFNYLKENPPKKQIVLQQTDNDNPNQKLTWQKDDYNGKFDLKRALVLVRRIRNNLFHGGKFSSGYEEDISRDKKLLRFGMIILEECLENDRNVSHYFKDSFLGKIE
jgi:hypothetical protein